MAAAPSTATVKLRESAVEAALPLTAAWFAIPVLLVAEPPTFAIATEDVAPVVADVKLNVPAVASKLATVEPPPI